MRTKIKYFLKDYWRTLVFLILLLTGLIVNFLHIKSLPDPSVKCAHVLAIGQNAAHDQWFMIIEYNKQPLSILSDDPVMAYWSEKLDPYHPNFVNIRWQEDILSHKLTMTSMSLCEQSKVPDSQ